jgi:hypothetical protein
MASTSLVDGFPDGFNRFLDGNLKPETMRKRFGKLPKHISRDIPEPIRGGVSVSGRRGIPDEIDLHLQ